MNTDLQEDVIVYISPQGEEVVQLPRSPWQKLGQKALWVLMTLGGVIMAIGLVLVALALFIYVVLPIVIIFLIWVFFKRWQFQKRWRRKDPLS